MTLFDICQVFGWTLLFVWYSQHKHTEQTNKQTVAFLLISDDSVQMHVYMTELE